MIKNFDIILNMPVGLNSFTHSITIHRGKINKRKEKIKKIFNL
jgi:hypothetical protein